MLHFCPGVLSRVSLRGWCVMLLSVPLPAAGVKRIACASSDFGLMTPVSWVQSSSSAPTRCWASGEATSQRRFPSPGRRCRLSGRTYQSSSPSALRRICAAPRRGRPSACLPSTTGRRGTVGAECMFPCPAYITEGSCLKLGICLGPRAQPARLLSRHLQVAWAFTVPRPTALLPVSSRSCRPGKQRRLVHPRSFF